MKFIKVEGWGKIHIARHEDKKRYKFFCGQTTRKSNAKELDKEDHYVESVCSGCDTIYCNRHLVSNRVDSLQVGTLLKCPRNVSETGWLRIVGDQRECKGNTLQPGIDDWDFKVVAHDHDNPKELFPMFNIKVKDIEGWNNNGF